MRLKQIIMNTLHPDSSLSCSVCPKNSGMPCKWDDKCPDFFTVASVLEAEILKYFEVKEKQPENKKCRF